MYRLYRRLSPFLRSFMSNLGLARGHCRHSPTCSLYSKQAINKHGIIKGSWLSVVRLLKCHPWSPGGFDPVP